MNHHVETFLLPISKKQAKAIDQAFKMAVGEERGYMVAVQPVSRFSKKSPPSLKVSIISKELGMKMAGIIWKYCKSKL